MRYRGVRLGLLLLYVAALSAAGYRVFVVEQRIANEAVRAREFEALSWDATHGLAEVRAAQHAYVAAGQGEGYWASQVARHLDMLGTQLAQLKQIAAAPEAGAALETAEARVQSFAQMDARARDYVTGGQRLMASDLIFTDGLELTAAASTDMESARRYERAVRERITREARLQQTYAALGAAGLGLVVLALLVPIPRRAEATRLGPVVDQVPVAPAQEAPETDLLARVSLRGAAGASEEAPASPPGGAALLRATAALCTDFSKVTQAADLPSLLERAAALLDASGIVVWMTDRSGSELRPALTYGYAGPVLARLGVIGRDEDNATAAAFRSGRTETVKGDERSGGAVIAPLLTPTGCSGVLAAEVRNGKEMAEATRALAEIVAAQVATLMAPTPAAEPAAPRRASGSA